MSTRERSGRSRSRWNTEDDMDISNSDDERKSRSQHSLREGILFSHSNYYQFLIKWVAEMSSKNPSREKVLKEAISQATQIERERINLPPHERLNVMHCDITIKGLSPCVFAGSGYGSERKMAYFAAAKDLMDKCLKMGIITRDLHEAIGAKPNLEPNRRLPDFVRALDVIHQLDSRISNASWRDNVEEKRRLSPIDLAQLDHFIAESREAVYGKDAPVYDESFCGLCKRKVHSDTCPYGVEEKRIDKLRRDQEDRERTRETRGRSRDRGRDAVREQKEQERMEIERKILEQREALAREDEERKLREATERARAAALAFGGGGIPIVGGPGAAPLLTPGLSGSANPIEMMMHRGGHSHPPNLFMHPFHPAPSNIGPSPEMIASMAQYSSMDPTGTVGYGNAPKLKEREPVPVPSGYAAHVQALEKQRKNEMARISAMDREREDNARREKTEAALRAELEQRLHEEIEQKRREMEMELREKLTPREARRIDMAGDFGATISAYGVNVSVPSPTPVHPPSVSMNPYGGMNAHFSHTSSYGMPTMAQNGISAMGMPPSNPYAPPSPLQSMQESMTNLPEYIEIRNIVNDNADTLKNLTFTRDPSLTNHPILTRISSLSSNSMNQTELRQLRDELKDFLMTLHRKAEEGRLRASGGTQREVRMERFEDIRDDRRRRRSRSRSRDRRDDRRRGGGGGDWTRGDKDGKRESYKSHEEDEELEVIVSVGKNRFRQLRAREAMRLKKDDLVVAQDLKEGKWSTGKVVRVSDKRVHVSVGNATWKKEFKEIYTPILNT